MSVSPWRSVGATSTTSTFAGNIKGNLFPVVREEDIAFVGITGGHESFFGRLATNMLQGLAEGMATEVLKTLISVRGKWYLFGASE